MMTFSPTAFAIEFIGTAYTRTRARTKTWNLFWNTFLIFFFGYLYFFSNGRASNWLHHPVSGTRVQTHNYSVVSTLRKQLDHGSSVCEHLVIAKKG
jgi:hypothetical protein